MRDFVCWPALFWDVARRILIYGCRRFGTTHLSHFRLFYSWRWVRYVDRYRLSHPRMRNLAEERRPQELL